MKIAFIGTEGIPGNYGGFETFVDNISYRLVSKGHEVTVFQPSDYKVDLANTKFANVKIEYVKCFKNKYLRAIMKRLHAFLKIKKNQYDVIHNFGPYANLFRFFNNKGLTIATLDGFEWNRASYNRLAKTYMKNTFVKCALYPHIAIVDSLIVQKFFDEKGIKTHFLPYGTNIIESNEELYQKFVDVGLEKDQYIYFVGRFVGEKNVHRLIQDYMQIESPIKLVIIGKGIAGEDYETKIRATAQNDKRIIFTGPLYGDDYRNIILNALGYVSASMLEGTSPALLDALGARRKVLVSDIPENKASLNNLGHYYPLNDEKESITILKRFLNNELYTSNEYEELMNYTYNTYEWNNIVDKYIEIIGERLENQ